MSVVGQKGYKETEVGWIPNDWALTRLNNLCSLVTKGTTPTTLGFSYQENGVNFIKVECIDGYGNIDLNKVSFISQEAHDALARSKLLAGDILYSIAGAIGRSAIVQKIHLPANINQALAIIRPMGGVEKNYLRFFLSSEYQLNHIAQISVSSAQANISLKDVSSFEILLPPKWEQQKIAAILTSVDDKLDIIAKQIEATQTLKRGLMQTLFSRGVGTQDDNGRWVPHTEFKDSELGEIPLGWDVGCVGDYISALRSGVSVNGEARAHGEGEVGVLKVGCVFEGRFLPDEHKTVVPEDVARVAEPARKGSIVISRANTSALVGESAFIEEDWPDLFLPDKLWQTVPSSLPHSVRWLAFYLQSPFAREEISKAATGTSGSMKNIAKPAFLGVPMPILPLAEQERIASILMAVAGKFDMLRAKQTRYQTLKRGLMQKLLTGEWRVKVEESDSVKMADVEPELA